MAHSVRRLLADVEHWGYVVDLTWIKCLLIITRDQRVFRHAGLDPASRFINDSKSFWIPAYAGMTIVGDQYGPSMGGLKQIRVLRARIL
jgi:hypothetical protein